MQHAGGPFRIFVASAAAVVPIAIAALLAFLVYNAWPAIHFNGWGFLTGNVWNLGNQYGDTVTVRGTEVLPGASFGILFLIAGTLTSSIIALLLAIPIGMGAAVFLAEAIPARLREPASMLVELLASVPSVVFGLWGYVVLIPFASQYIYPHMAHVLGFIPFFSGPTRNGYGLLTSGIVLALMVVPLITSNMREAVMATPKELREAGLATGATRFEVMRRIIIPRLRLPLIGVSTLALGRALGETMAVLMVSGNAVNGLPRNIYSSISTMAAFMVSQLDSALQDPSGMAVNSITEIGLILLLISMLVNGVARMLVSRLQIL
ncbi:MAG: phosphate ABC transporter permease subunit PstC [Pseudomonadota bacterium]|jgi:phosphate transport system permease protein|nr:phosphate ABC transporter permease subunit PstC [Pseudomonadota bacterium]